MGSVGLTGAASGQIMFRYADSSSRIIELPDPVMDSINKGVVMDMVVHVDSIDTSKNIGEMSVKLPVYGNLANFVFLFNGEPLSGGFYDRKAASDQSVLHRQVLFRSFGPFNTQNNSVLIRIRYTQYWRDSDQPKVIEKI